MPDVVIASAEGHAVPIRLIAEGAEIADGRAAAWARANGFKGAAKCWRSRLTTAAFRRFCGGLATPSIP